MNLQTQNLLLAGQGAFRRLDVWSKLTTWR
jgi:hypothetical protein